MNQFEFEDIDSRGTHTPPVDYKKFLLKLLQRWYYIVFVFLISVSIGYLVNRYSTPVYSVSATIITKKFSKQGFGSNVFGLAESSYLLSGMTEVYEEIPLLKSYSRISETIKRLNFGVSYFSKGVIKTTETLSGEGFKVKIDSIIGKSVPYGVSMIVEQQSENTFLLKTENAAWQKTIGDHPYHFDSLIQLGNIRFTVLKTANNINDESAKNFFIFNNKESLINSYRSRLNITWVQQGSAMLNLKINSTLPEKELTFINTYYEVIEEVGLQDKNEYLTNSIEFIDTQMKTLTDSIVFYQEIIDGLKLENTNLNFSADYVFNRLNLLDQKKAEILLGERYYDYLENYIKEKRGAEVFAPNLIGLNAPLLSGLVNQYITGKMEEQYARNAGNTQNPVMILKNSKRSKLEQNIFEAIYSLREKNKEDIRELNNNRSFLMASIKGMQADFRELDKVNMVYGINKRLFDMFLTRKAEATITRASATSDYEIVNGPSYASVPIRPNKQNNLILAAVLGLILPAVFFLIRDITNKYVLDKDDLVHATSMPLLGNVAHSSLDSKIVMMNHARTVASESFRALRANIRFLVGSSGEKASNVYMITSSVSGEGKTFCAINLGYTFALSNKKTLIIGADMRKPAMVKNLNMPSGKGLSEYLAGLVNLKDVITKGEEGNDNLYFIGSGAIPPNPSELLGGDRMKNVLDELRKEFDYVIIDTPPIGLISDALSLIHLVDYTFLIVRQKVTEKAALKMINELYVDEKLTQASVIFNDIDINKKRSYYGGYMYGMGYGGYGYGYYEEDKKV